MSSGGGGGDGGDAGVTLFPFYDLPPEIRADILRLVVIDGHEHEDVVSVFLASHRMYREAASLFYRDVCIFPTPAGVADAFLARPANRLRARRFVRCLSIRFSVRKHIELFTEPYGAVLHDMVENGQLQQLRLEIGWDADYDDKPVPLVLAGKKQEEDSSSSSNGDREIKAPRFVTKPPFQNFLKLLPELKIPKIALTVFCAEHFRFLCAFHRAHPSGKACTGTWKGGPEVFLDIDWKAMVSVLEGARVAPSVKKYPFMDGLSEDQLAAGYATVDLLRKVLKMGRGRERLLR